MSRRRRATAPEDGATPFDVAQARLRHDAAQMRRLGTDEPICVVCGEIDPEKLLLLEEDHLTGRHEGPVAILCRNCHARRTAQSSRGPQRFLAADRSELERIGALLDHRGDHLADLGRIDKAMARYLLELTKRVAQDVYRDIPSPFVTRKDRRQ
jgi:hypothetical protein